MQQSPTPDEIALHIITHPNDFEAEPAVRAAAWAAMKQARGQTADLDSMAHILLETHRATITAQAIAQVRQTIEGALDTDRLHNIPQRIRVSQRIRSHTAHAQPATKHGPRSPTGDSAA